jgi:sugar lactone lactonase YvrE
MVVLAAMLSSSGAMGASPSQLQDPPHASLNQFEVREIGRLGVLGVPADDSTQTFGDISALAVDEDRDVLFVLDRLNHRLSAYTLAGEFIASTGGKGEGPGELMDPVAVVADQATAHVMDWGANRVTRFELDADSLRYAGEQRLPVLGPTNLCRLQDAYYVMRYQDNRFGRIIHRIDRSGDVTLSFGPPFIEGDAFVANVTPDPAIVRPVPVRCGPPSPGGGSRTTVRA